MNTKKIIEVAQKYLGMQEVTGNNGFLDKSFENKMRSVGWHQKFAWCALFAELVAKEAFADDPVKVAEFDKLFSASAVATWYNFAGSKNYKTTKVPKTGALVIWKSPKSWTGHIGIIESMEKDGKYFNVIEGNGSLSGSREGTHVVRKRRKLDIAPRRHGAMYMLGFVYLC